MIFFHVQIWVKSWEHFHAPICPCSKCWILRLNLQKFIQKVLFCELFQPKNISLRGNLDSSANISPEIAWFTGQLGLFKIWFPMFKMIHYNFLCVLALCTMKIDHFRAKKSILDARNQFLSQEINSCYKKLFLLSSQPSVKLNNSWQRVNPTKKFAWAYTIRGNLVPRFPENLPPWWGGMQSHFHVQPH